MSATKTPHFSWQRSSRVTDLSLPNDLSCTEEVSLYQGLRGAERRLDWTLARKVMEVQDSLSKNMPVGNLGNRVTGCFTVYTNILLASDGTHYEFM